MSQQTPAARPKRTRAPAPPPPPDENDEIAPDVAHGGDELDDDEAEPGGGATMRARAGLQLYPRRIELFAKRRAPGLRMSKSGVVALTALFEGVIALFIEENLRHAAADHRVVIKSRDLEAVRCDALCPLRPVLPRDVFLPGGGIPPLSKAQSKNPRLYSDAHQKRLKRAAADDEASLMDAADAAGLDDDGAPPALEAVAPSEDEEEEERPAKRRRRGRAAAAADE